MRGVQHHAVVPVCLRAIVILVALGLASSLAALNPERAISQYVRTTWEDRLPHNTVRALLQTRDGFLWIGTYEGVVRFDGADFTVFDTRSSAMTSSAISAMAEDARGVLWVGTAGGGLYRYDGETMRPFALGALGPMVSAMAADPDGSVWVATRRGLGRVRNGALELLSDQPGAPTRLIWSVCSTGPGEVWIGTEGGGLIRFAEGRFRTMTTADGLSSDVVYSLARSAAGGLWIGTSAGVDYMDGGRIRSGLPAGSPLNGAPAFALLEDRDRNLWIGGGNEGVCRMAAGEVRCEAIDESGPDLIRTFIEDREGNLWVGGTHRGISQLRDGKLMTTTGLQSTNHVRTVTADANGTIWVGTDGSGVNVVRDGMLEPIPANDALPSRFVRTLHAARDGSLWIGTLEGLSRLKGGKLTNYRVTEGLSSNIVYVVIPSRDGSLWVGTSAGMNRVRDGAIEAVAISGDVRALHEDRTGRLWIGRRDGLSCLERDGRTTDCGAPGPVRISTVFSFHETADGAVWIGTNHGVTRAAAGRFKTYGGGDGLFDQNVFHILEDGRGFFWMSSNRGIWSVPVADFGAYDRGEIIALRSTAYGKSDGMASAQCNGGSQPAGWKAADGKLWFPTARGVVTVDPLHLEPSRFAPPAVVTNVFIDGRPYPLGKLDAIPPDTERIEFHYAGLSFVAPEKVRFRFKLEGFDREWVNPGTRRVAYYTNPPRGSLKFHVVASNADGIWNPEVTTLPVTLEPHFYDAAWFRLLAFATALAMVFGITRLWMRQQRRRELELIRLVDERTEALREANAALERLAAVDGLTRLPNRRSLDSRLDTLWKEHMRRGASLAVILCDVDHFKRFNDARGHLAGDEALISVAAAIQSTMKRSTDFAARYGGEEFVILLGDTTLDQARVVGERLLENVQRLGIEHPDSPVAPVVTLSAGIAAMVPRVDVSVDEFLNAADEALYRAKAAGRNSLVPAEHEPALKPA